MARNAALYRLARALEGLPILGCLAGTPAALAGVRYGDVLLSVNGSRVRSFDEYAHASSLRTDGMSVVVFRNGTELPLEFSYSEDRSRSLSPAALLSEVATMGIDLSGDDSVDVAS